jgi:folate-binding protein YgfZ
VSDSIPTTATVADLERDAVLLPEAGRELIVATGADRVRFLHGIVTADLAGAAPGQGRRSALLTPKAQVVAEMQMFVREGEIWIVVGAGQAESVAGALARYAIMDDFAAAARPDFGLLSLVGPNAGTRLAQAGIAPGSVGDGPARGHADVAAGVAAPGETLWLARMRELGQDGFWLGGERARVTAVRARLREAGVGELSPASAEALRIAALEPRAGTEITADYFPMEVGLNDAIDYGKGCFLGQEPIVRIRDRGHVNWRLCGLDIEGTIDPSGGDVLESDAKPKAGRVTSAGRLPDGRGVALAMVHVSIPVGGALRIRHGETTIPALVRAEA